MADQRDGGIAWCDETWGPIRGCSRVNQSCTRCYAEAIAIRFSKPGLAYHGLTRISKKTGKPLGWNGEVKVVEDRLEDPLRWRRARRIFVNSMSDLFHENLPLEEIVRVYAVMGLAERHTFMTLTKRPERQREILSSPTFWTRVGSACENYAQYVEKLSAGAMMGFDAWWHQIEERRSFPNVQIGVSVGAQVEADEFLPHLAQTPAAIRWASYEPAWGPVDFDRIQIPDERAGLYFSALHPQHSERFGSTPNTLDLVVIGGESHRDRDAARPFDIRWARAALSQCAESGTKAFMKQVGSNPVGMPRTKHPRGEDPAEWPEDLRVRELPTREDAA